MIYTWLFFWFSASLEMACSSPSPHFTHSHQLLAPSTAATSLPNNNKCRCNMTYTFGWMADAFFRTLVLSLCPCRWFLQRGWRATGEEGSWAQKNRRKRFWLSVCCGLLFFFAHDLTSPVASPPLTNGAYNRQQHRSSCLLSSVDCSKGCNSQELRTKGCS